MSILSENTLIGGLKPLLEDEALQLLIKQYTGKDKVEAGDLAAMIQNIVSSSAPKNHASTSTTYGLAGDSKYGHVALSNKVTHGTGYFSEGIAESFKVVNGTVDLNNYKQEGNYLLSSGSHSNRPSGIGSKNGYHLMVWRRDQTGDCCLQILSADYTNDIWIRYRYGNSWYTWYKLITTADSSTIVSDCYKIIGTVSNFNSATSEGKYRITNGTNAPYTDCTDWICLVYHLSGGTNELYQIAMEECHSGVGGGATTSTGVPRIFARKRINGTWYSWQEIITTGNKSLFSW